MGLSWEEPRANQGGLVTPPGRGVSTSLASVDRLAGWAAGLQLGLGIDVFYSPTRSLTVLTVSYTHEASLNLKQILMRVAQTPSLQMRKPEARDTCVRERPVTQSQVWSRAARHQGQGPR